MADIKISQFGAAQNVSDSDVFAGVSGGVNVKTAASTLKNYIIGNTDISAIGNGTPTGAIAALESSKADSSDLATVATTGAYSDLSGLPTLGTAAAKNSTNAVTQGSTSLVESGGVQTAIKSTSDTLDGKIGTLSNLTTSAKTSAVVAINEVNGKVGTLSSLTTTAKTDAVAAINEVNGKVGNSSSGLVKDVTDLKDTVGNSTNGLVKDVNDLQDGVSGITDNMFANGVVNILPNNATSGTGDGIEYTVNNDGSVTVNGTNTGDDQFFSILVSTVGLKGENFHFSGCPANGTLTTYAIRIENYTKSKVYHDFGEGVDVSLSENEGIRVNIMVRAGTTINNLTFKPMITLKDVPNSDYTHYVPYVKSNSILTEDVADLQDDVGEISENIRELGALNLCNCTNPGTVLDGTLTITRTDDGTYTLNGTVSENKSVVLTDTFTVEEGVYYTISGGLNNDSETTQKLWVTSDAFPLGNRLQTDLGMNNLTAQASTTATATLSLIVRAGNTYDNATIKPMVVIGKHNYNYVPYTMSNRKLTEKKLDVNYSGNIINPDNYTKTGIYQGYLAFSPINEGWGILIVTNGGEVITQTGINGAGIASRKYASGSWSAWTKTLFS